MKVSLPIAAILFLRVEGFSFHQQKLQHHDDHRATRLSAASSLSSAAAPTSHQSAALKRSPSVQDPAVQAQKWQELYQRVGSSSDGGLDLLCLQHINEEYRGVFLNRNVVAGDAVLSVPLSFCYRDDQPPEWFTYQNFSDWATRLAACLLDRQLKLHCTTTETDRDSSLDQLWLSLLPDASYLKASLPVHWSEDTLKSAASTALELAVDTAYFARAGAVHDLMVGLDNTLLETTTTEERRRLCENALDLVQTRSCRISLSVSDDECRSQPLRILAPVFDFINHSSRPNGAFALQGDRLVVTALRDLHADEEVLIDYGISARPAWKCLSSYGFVPALHSDHGEEAEHIAEVFVDGFRYEVGPTTIPEDMVAAVAAQDQQSATVVDVELTPEIAIRLASRISEAAFNMLLDPWESKYAADTTRSLAGESADDEEDAQTPEEILSFKLAASLRFNQHHTLLACSMGLREWAVQQKSVGM